MKYLIMLLLSFGLLVGTGCSSSDSESEETNQSEEFSEDSEDFVDAEEDEDLGDLDEEELADEDSESEEDFGDEDFGEEESEEDIADSDDFGDEDEFSEEEDVQADLGDDEENLEEQPLAEDSLLAENDTSEETDIQNDEPVAQGEFEDQGGTPADSEDSFGQGEEVADTSTEEDNFGDDFDASVDEESVEEVVSKPSWIPVKKIDSFPRTKMGKPLNTVYIVRPGDSPEEVAIKTLGSPDTEMLYGFSPHLRRSFKVGDKVYYNSPNRPGDSSRVITYYEDNNIPSSTYFARSGENIRAVSSNLLGDPGSWKEIWATNPSVDSKGILDSDIELTYWPTGSEPSGPSLAQNSFNEPPQQEVVQPVAQIPPPAPPAPPAPPQNIPPPAPPSQNLAANNVAMGSVGNPPPNNPAANITPPPVAPQVTAAPPAPPKPKLKRKKRKVKKKAAGGRDMMMTVAGILLAAGAVIYFVIRKNKAKKMKMDITEQTQI
ncbi:MAG: hypothetical protein AB8E15_11195 [Bdellovibrionales bacterium]